MKLLRRSSITARTPHRKKSFSRTASLLRPQARSTTSALTVAAMASAVNDDANNDGLSPPSSAKPHALHDVKAPARARSARNGADLLAGDWCRGIAKGLSGSSNGAGSCNGSGGSDIGRRRSGLPLPSSRGHRMFQVQEALNRAACAATSTAAAVSTSSSSSLENEEGIGSPASSVSSDGSIGCDDALPVETRMQQLGRRGRSLASPAAAKTDRAYRSRCCPPSPLTSLEIVESGYYRRCRDRGSGSMMVAGSAQSVACDGGGAESGNSGNDTGNFGVSDERDSDSIDATTDSPPVAAAAAACAADCPPFTCGGEENRGAPAPSSFLEQQQQKGYSGQWSGRHPLSFREDTAAETLEKNGSVEKSCSAVCGGGGQGGSPMSDSPGGVKTPLALTSRKSLHVDDAEAAAARLASEGVGLVSCNKDGLAGLLAAGSQSSLSKEAAGPEWSDLGRSSEVGGEVSLQCEQVSDSCSPLMTGPVFEDEVKGAVPGSSPPSRYVFCPRISRMRVRKKWPRLPSLFLSVSTKSALLYIILLRICNILRRIYCT